ncbi:NAD-dependent epimerase/dehydratase family protein [Tabrizicola sp. J26]|uniref:NAD-dependent epimerase/dehydratase family protein n=1 Tax=Alitabrizicola rongguiensis TaxID=2909234 RepID=UPI001F42E523|nr:NAD-dependent epimerase/dehydratase family protein [Tabrizicola rongguiensis]MCF1711115.1 NAD-dependent epimerase/dehydratase family protein [Tabrizicola rongguiensis]
MSLIIVTGSGGLVGSESARFFHEKGWDVVGIDNDMRSQFFGADASTSSNRQKLERDLKRYTHVSVDIRDGAAIEALFARYGTFVDAVIHAAAQPSHDWAARDPQVDFGVNAVGTLNMLEAARRHCPNAPFVFTSTNKVYGDTPNRLPLVENETRWVVDPSHPYSALGIDESMSVDQTLHSVFGASKTAADIMVQEYGRYFGMPTAAFRGGCLTGPAHAGAELHGFLAYLVRAVVDGLPYRIFGHKAKQVRDNLHAHDLVEAFWEFVQAPRSGEVYNIGGGIWSNCSMIEAIGFAESYVGKKLDWTYLDEARIGDHIFWISDVSKFRAHFPAWSVKHDVPAIIREIADACLARR